MMPKSNIIFESKRNHCYYDWKKKCVVKKFQYTEHYLSEKTMLIKLGTCSDLKVARLLDFDDESATLELEYINGDLLLEQLEVLESSLNINGAIYLLNELIKWLNKFYKYTEQTDDQGNRINMIYGDVNLRNFIVSEEGIVGIDLEQCKIGDPKEEVEYLLAMFMEYNPIDSLFKRRVCNKVSHENNINMSHIKEEMNEIRIRRK